MVTAPFKAFEVMIPDEHFGAAAEQIAVEFTANVSAGLPPKGVWLIPMDLITVGFC